MIVMRECPYGKMRTNRKTHYRQGCSDTVKRVYDTTYCCFLKTEKFMRNINPRGFSDFLPFFFRYNTPFGEGRLGDEKKPFHIEDKRAATW